MSNIEKIREKISALLKKNEQNGASEAEATAALNFAQKLMDEHGVKLSDLKDSSPSAIRDFGVSKTQTKYKTSTVDQYLVEYIAYYTDVKAIFVSTKSQKHAAIGKNRKVHTVAFFGYSIDVELALFLYEICESAIEHEWRMFSVKLPVGDRASNRKLFEVGMAARLRTRILELKEAQTSSTPGHQLVVLKTDIVLKAFEKASQGAPVEEYQSTDMISYVKNKPMEVFVAGMSAGDNVGLHREVNRSAE